MIHKNYTGETYHEAYQKFQSAAKTGKCEECGWRDGDGVTTCFYSDVLGGVTHQNSDKAVREKMSKRQQSLFDSYNSYRTALSRADYDKAKQTAEQEIRDCTDPACFEQKRGGCWYLRCHYPKSSYPTKESVIARYLHHDAPTSEHGWALEDYLAAGWKVKSESSLGYKNIYKPHVCGGFAEYAGAYHISCTGCGTEVKLWEFGVDYDIG